MMEFHQHLFGREIANNIAEACNVEMIVLLLTFP